MRLVILTRYYPPRSTEGIPRTRMLYARELVKLGHEVHVITSGSEGFETDGSTSPGPGLRRKTSGVFMEKKMRAEESLGIVAVVTEPGAPRRIAQSTPRGLRTPGGD